MEENIDINKLEENIREARARLEASAAKVMDEGKSLGEDENVLRQSRYLDELILTEQHLRMAQNAQRDDINE